VVKAYADYGIKVPSVIQKDNVFACQFHPEKSGVTGLKIIENFCKL
ncbi:MAG: imidazole glycerol phosphate synthase subunit HisH, partial [Treponema sp.]|nr:imidazole glycerol phosphate synthase subunit HisH [Treponema sp.]